MKKTALIQIDNRPVCFQLPKMNADMDKNTLLYMPDRKLLGSLNKNANIQALFEWLEELPEIDNLIISADTLIYGGLIPSRKGEESYRVLEQRILKLRNILLEKNCKTFLFSSIMRISNNNINEEEKPYWNEWGEKIFAYSYNLHRTEVEGNPSAKEKVIKLSSEIPKDILVDWLSTRVRNFEINKLYLNLYDDGLIDTLIYAKDDCSQFGLNVKEAKYFEYEAETRKGVYVKTGADEIPLTLLARTYIDKPLKIAPVYTHPECIKLVSNYEDISVKESVKSQIETTGCIESSVDEADLILYVNNFKNEQGELVMNVDTLLFDGKFLSFDKPYCIADIVNANGADNKFVAKILNSDLNNFYGYSGWNTTGNTLGSVLCTAIIKLKSKNLNEKAFNILQTVRFLDDWAYQAILRKVFKNSNITDNEKIIELFEPYEQRIKEHFDTKDLKTKFLFPWNRFFEIEIMI